jgi:bla regulator protein blaR1
MEAMQEQLGLRLKPGKVPLKVIVVDHVHRPSEN